MNPDFQPVIVGFLCNWCSYTGADLAGTSRAHYPPNLRIIRVMCSGRVEPSFILKALTDGADGVLVAGCHPGDCHYQEGNYKTMRRMKLLSRMLDQFGIERERVRLEWISASEANMFVEVVEEMTKQLRELGPLQLGHAEDRNALLETVSHQAEGGAPEAGSPEGA